MNNERSIKIMKKAVKILLGCAAVGTIATVVTKIVKDIKEEKEYEASLEDDDNESEFVDEDIENEMENEFEDEKSTEDFDKKVNDVTPKPININNI